MDYQDHQDQGDITVYKNVLFKEKMLEHLAETSKKLYKNIKNKTLKIKKESQKKELNHLTIDFKKVGQLFQTVLYSYGKHFWFFFIASLNQL